MPEEVEIKSPLVLWQESMNALHEGMVAGLADTLNAINAIAPHNVIPGFLEGGQVSPGTRFAVAQRYSIRDHELSPSGVKYRISKDGYSIIMDVKDNPTGLRGMLRINPAYDIQIQITKIYYNPEYKRLERQLTPIILLKKGTLYPVPAMPEISEREPARKWVLLCVEIKQVSPTGAKPMPRPSPTAARRPPRGRRVGRRR